MENKILKLLERSEMTTTAIATALNENYWKVVVKLQDLEKEGKIVREKKPNQTFWHLVEFKTADKLVEDKNEK